MAEQSGRKVINGKYRLLTELDEGGMGTVWLAEQLDVEGRALRQVALKTIRRELSADPTFAQRFLREVRIATQLRNPHTVTVYDVGQGEDGQLYFVMEFINGPTLRQMLPKNRSLPAERAVAIAVQMCEALSEAHNLPAPVVHRDLKPSNIFVEERHKQDWIKIGDFGIAKILGEQTMGLTQIGQASPGTPPYMAPEQWQGTGEDGRTDLYAVGVILYEMLTGYLPFRASTRDAMKHQHLSVLPPPLPTTVPTNLRVLVERLLAKAPQDRPAATSQVQDALAAILRGEDERSTIIVNTPQRQPASDNGHAEAQAEQRTLRRDDLPQSPLASLPVPSSPRISWRAVLMSVSVSLGLFLILVAWWEMGAQSHPVDGSTVRTSTPLALRLAVMKRRNNLVSVLKEGEEIIAGDYYGVFFEPAQASFVYVLQQDATGKIDVLFPDSKVTPQSNPVSAKQAVWVPKDEQHWFYLDKHTGREVIFVVAASQRDDKLETFLQHLDDTQTQGALAQWITSPERGRGGVKQIDTKPRMAPGGKSLDLETALVQGNGADFVYKVVFQHK